MAVHPSTASAATLDHGSTGLLRLALRLDAAVTAANGAAYVAAAGPLSDLLGTPAATLRGVGAFLLAFSAAVWLVARRPEPHAAAVWAVVAANVLWVFDSLAAAAFAWGSPTTAGTVWIVLQAAVVAGFAALQAHAQRRR